MVKVIDDATCVEWTKLGFPISTFSGFCCMMHVVLLWLAR